MAGIGKPYQWLQKVGNEQDLCIRSAEAEVNDRWSSAKRQGVTCKQEQHTLSGTTSLRGSQSGTSGLDSFMSRRETAQRVVEDDRAKPARVQVQTDKKVLANQQEIV